MNHTTNDQIAAQARQEDLVVQELPDEVLVYDLKQHKAHCLNQTAAFVWNHCDGQTKAAEIAKLMEKEWRKPVSEDVVWLALNQLSKAGLLQERISISRGGVNFSRRGVLRKLALTAAVALPLVVSVIAPVAASALSIPVQCLACAKKEVTGCPNVCGALVTGSCFKNNGCGNGEFIATMTCPACFALPTGGSWRAPN